MQKPLTHAAKSNLAIIPSCSYYWPAAQSIMTMLMCTRSTTILASYNRRSMARSHLPTTAHLSKRMYYAKPCIAVNRFAQNAFEQCVREQEHALYPMRGRPVVQRINRNQTRRVLDKTQTENDSVIAQAVILSVDVLP